MGSCTIASRVLSGANDCPHMAKRRHRVMNLIDVYVTALRVPRECIASFIDDHDSFTAHPLRLRAPNAKAAPW